MFQIISNSVEETFAIAKKIASVFRGGDLIMLDGDMGAGKTHFVKGIANGFNYSEKVISPTFNIANFYVVNDLNILHIDLYRIDSVEEFDDLGITEYFDSSIVFMEWGMRIADSFDDYILISFDIDKENENRRKINFSSKGSIYKDRIEQIKNIGLTKE